jgi:hypothetical protein
MQLLQQFPDPSRHVDYRSCPADALAARRFRMDTIIPFPFPELAGESNAARARHPNTVRSQVID